MDVTTSIKISSSSSNLRKLLPITLDSVLFADYADESAQRSRSSMEHGLGNRLNFHLMLSFPMWLNRLWAFFSTDKHFLMATNVFPKSADSLVKPQAPSVLSGIPVLSGRYRVSSFLVVLHSLTRVNPLFDGN